MSSVCTNPDILKVLYFIFIIIDIVKIIIPVALIILGIVDFSKAVIISDEKVQKKTVNLFLKRLLYAALVFAVPWIVEVVMVSLGNLADGVNFTDCIENANADTIAALEAALELEQEKCGEEKLFTIFYYDDDGTTVIGKQMACTEEMVTLKEFSRPGYELKNWKLNYGSVILYWNSGEETFFSLDSYKDLDENRRIDLIAVWEEKSGSYCYYCSTSGEYRYGTKPTDPCLSASGWEADYSKVASNCGIGIDNDYGHNVLD